MDWFLSSFHWIKTGRRHKVGGLDFQIRLPGILPSFEVAPWKKGGGTNEGMAEGRREVDPVSLFWILVNPDYILGLTVKHLLRKRIPFCKRFLHLKSPLRAIQARLLT